LARLRDARVLGRAREDLPDHRCVLGMDEVERRRAGELFGRVAEDPRHRRAHVTDAGLGVDDRGDVDRVLDQRTETRFALAQGGTELGSPLGDATLELHLRQRDTHLGWMSSESATTDSAQIRISAYSEPGRGNPPNR